MTPEQRMLCKVSEAVDHAPAAVDRFNALVTIRRSWAYWFLARSVGL